MRLNERVKRLQATSKASVVPGTEPNRRNLPIEDDGSATSLWLREILEERRKQRAE
jgi:hypothetical protein